MSTSAMSPSFAPTTQPTVLNVDLITTFTAGGAALFAALVAMFVYFGYGFIRQVGFFRYTRMTRPCSMVFMQAYERMHMRIQQKLEHGRRLARAERDSAVRAAVFLVAATLTVAAAAPVVFVYMSIGIQFQALLIYRTFPVQLDPLVSNTNFLEFVRQWWSTVIRYIVPTQRNLVGPPYNPVPYDTTVIYAPLLTVFSWLVNLTVDFSGALRGGVVCQGSYVAPLELLLDVAILFVLVVVIEGDYVMLLGPVMNGTYDKYMERMYRDKGYGSKCRAVLSIFLCGLYRVVDLPTQFVNALHFLSTLVATRVFFLADGGWRHASSPACDRVIIKSIANPTVDTDLAVLSTLGFYILVVMAVALGSKVMFPLLYAMTPDEEQERRAQRVAKRKAIADTIRAKGLFATTPARDPAPADAEEGAAGDTAGAARKKKKRRPRSTFAFGYALPDALRGLYVLCSVDILLVQLLCLFGWCVFGRWGCCDTDGDGDAGGGGDCCVGSVNGGGCCGDGCCAGCDCDCDADPDWHDHPAAPAKHTARLGATATTADGLALALGPDAPRWPKQPVNPAFYFEYLLPQNKPEKKALLLLERRPHAFSELFFEVLYDWLSFGKAALGWWGEDTLDCLVERKIRKMRLHPLLEDGYAGEVLAAVMKPRAAYLRVFPYCSPAALLVQQMASTPACFLLYPFEKPSPVYDKLQAAIVYKKDGVRANEHEQWPTVVYWPLHVLSDRGAYIGKIVWNLFLTGLPLGIAFIPTSKWNIFLPLAIISVIFMAAFRALQFIIDLGKFIGVRDGDFDLLFGRKQREEDPSAPASDDGESKHDVEAAPRVLVVSGSKGITTRAASPPVATQARSRARSPPPPGAAWGDVAAPVPAPVVDEPGVAADAVLPPPPPGPQPARFVRPASPPAPAAAAAAAAPYAFEERAPSPSPFAAAAAISTAAVAVAVAALNGSPPYSDADPRPPTKGQDLRGDFGDTRQGQSYPRPGPPASAYGDDGDDGAGIEPAALDTTDSAVLHAFRRFDAAPPAPPPPRDMYDEVASPFVTVRSGAYPPPSYLDVDLDFDSPEGPPSSSGSPEVGFAVMRVLPTGGAPGAADMIPPSTPGMERLPQPASSWYYTSPQSPPPPPPPPGSPPPSPTRGGYAYGVAPPPPPPPPPTEGGGSGLPRLQQRLLQQQQQRRYVA